MDSDHWNKGDTVEASAGGLNEWMECPYCGLFQSFSSKERMRACRRCHGSFGHGRPTFQIALPLAVTAAILFVIMQFYPLIRMELDGLSQVAGIGSGVVGLYDHGLSPIAMVVLFACIGAPLFRIAANTCVLVCLQCGYRWRHLAIVFRLSEQMRPWAMLDVLLLGTLIAVTKLHDLATVDVGIGLWSLGFLVLTLAVLDTSLDRRAVWAALSPGPGQLSPPDPSRFVSCLSCGMMQSGANFGDQAVKCSRCARRLFRRKPDSLNRTWALVLTGVLLYIPANIYPALTVISFGQGTPSTIMAGVVELMNGEDWPLALLIFTASVAVPILKLAGLMALLLSIHCKTEAHLLDRTRLFRIIEFIGRWSMIDVFVAALLTALVTLGRVATIEPGPGILAFGAVVVATMFAAENFDPRLMWDRGRVCDE